MENCRQVLRGSASAVLVFLAVSGISVQVALGNDFDPFFVKLVIICNLVIGFLEGSIGIIITRYFKKQQQKVDDLSEKLGLSPDCSWRYATKVAYFALVGLVAVLVSWLIYLLAR